MPPPIAPRSTQSEIDLVNELKGALKNSPALIYPALVGTLVSRDPAYANKALRVNKLDVRLDTCVRHLGEAVSDVCRARCATDSCRVSLAAGLSRSVRAFVKVLNDARGVAARCESATWTLLRCVGDTTKLGEVKDSVRVAADMLDVDVELRRAPEGLAPPLRDHTSWMLDACASIGKALNDTITLLNMARSCFMSLRVLLHACMTAELTYWDAAPNSLVRRCLYEFYEARKARVVDATKQAASYASKLARSVSVLSASVCFLRRHFFAVVGEHGTDEQAAKVRSLDAHVAMLTMPKWILARLGFMFKDYTLAVTHYGGGIDAVWAASDAMRFTGRVGQTRWVGRTPAGSLVLPAPELDFSRHSTLITPRDALSSIMAECLFAYRMVPESGCISSAVLVRTPFTVANLYDVANIVCAKSRPQRPASVQ